VCVCKCMQLTPNAVSALRKASCSSLLACARARSMRTVFVCFSVADTCGGACVSCMHVRVYPQESMQERVLKRASMVVFVTVWCVPVCCVRVCLWKMHKRVHFKHAMYGCMCPCVCLRVCKCVRLCKCVCLCVCFSSVWLHTFMVIEHFIRVHELYRPDQTASAHKHSNKN